MKYDKIAVKFCEDNNINNVSDATQEALNNAYDKILAEPVRVEPAKKHRGIKAVSFSAAGIAACITLLFAVNFAFPAFAEGLPLIGGVFKQLNSVPDNGVMPKSALQNDTIVSNAQPVSEQDVSSVYVVPNGKDEIGVTYEIKEVYFDGLFVHMGIEITPEGGAVDEWHPYLLNPMFDMKINGEEVKLTYLAGDYGLSTEEAVCDFGDTSGSKIGDKYINALSFRLPKKFEGANSLTFTLDFSSVSFITWMDTKYNAEGGYDSTEKENTGKGELRITANKDNKATIKTVKQELTVNDVTFEFAKLADSAMEVGLSMPTSQEADMSPNFLSADGTRIQQIANYADMLGYEESHISKERIILNALPEGDDELVIIVRNRNDPEFGVLAEFTVNFADGTVKSTKNYEDENSPFYNDYTGNYVVGYGYFPEIDELPDSDYYISYLDGGDGEISRIIVETNQAERELNFELYRNGNLLVKSLDMSYHKEGLPGIYLNREYDGTYYIGAVMDEENRYYFDKYDEVTLKITDKVTGRLVHEEIVTLDDDKIVYN